VKLFRHSLMPARRNWKLMGAATWPHG